MTLDIQSPQLGVKDDLLYGTSVVADDDQRLFLIGSNGLLRRPEFWRSRLGCSLENISHLVRGLLSLEKESPMVSLS